MIKQLNPFLGKGLAKLLASESMKPNRGLESIKYTAERDEFEPLTEASYS